MRWPVSLHGATCLISVGSWLCENPRWGKSYCCNSELQALRSEAKRRSETIEIVLFILLAGVWAALLIPSFVTSRREAPIHSTESFARSTARLAAVRGASVESAANRSRVRARRRQILMGLGSAAIATLAVSIVTGSWTWLSINLIADALLAAYVAMLLQVKEHSLARAQERGEVALEAAEQADIRVVAG